MSLLAPFWLLVSLVGGVIVAFHAQRRKRVVVSSLMLFRRLAERHAARPSWQLPKPSWPLVLQLLVVALCALALAQPHWGARPAQHLVYILDASGSMTTRDASQGFTRFEAARAAIEAEVEALDPALGPKLSLITLAPDVQAEAVAFTDRAAFVAVLTAQQASHGVANDAGLDDLVRAIVREDEETSVTLLTDNLDLEAISGIALTTRLFGDPATANGSIWAQVEQAADSGDWTVSGEVLLTDGAAANAIAVRFRPHSGNAYLHMGEISLRGIKSVSPDEKRLPFNHKLTLPRPGVLHLALPEDAAEFDSEAWLAVEDSAHPLKALYIGLGNPTLERALLVRGDVELSKATSLPADIDTYDIVFADNVVLPVAPRTNVVWLGSARGPGVEKPALAPAARPLVWDQSHMLGAGISWQSIDLLPVHAFSPMQGAATILATDAGQAIEARTMAWGREMRVALEFGDAPWTRGDNLPILVNRIIEWIGGGRKTLVECRVGEVCPVPARSLGSEIRSPEGHTVWSVPATDGIVPDGITESFSPTMTGVYTGSDGRLIVVSNALPEPVSVEISGENVSGGLSFSVWQMLLAAAAVILIAELALAGRGRWVIITRLGATALLVAGMFAVPLPGVQRDADIVTIGATGSGRCGLVTTTAIPRLASDLDCASGEQAVAQTATVNLAGAAEIAAAMTRPGATSRLVIESDGTQTLGDLARNLPTLVSRSIPVDVMPVAGHAHEGLYAALVDVPAPLYAGDKVELTAAIHSPRATSETISLVSGGNIIETRLVDLSERWNRVDFFLPELAPDDAVYELQLGEGESAVLGTRFALDVHPGLSVAIVTPDRDWGEVFAAALDIHGVRASVIAPQDAPVEAEDWLEYDAIALLNMPAIALSTDQQRQIEEYVRLHGGGLLLLGGENTFGPGGYFRTPLEDLSPLSARVDDELPVVAIAFVLDRSGSMQAQVQGTSRLDIAKEATIGAVELLKDESQIAVVVFDAEAHVVSPLREKDIARLEQALAAVKPGGGTYFMPALEAGLAELLRSDAPVRHIILMSDGVSQPGEYEAFAAETLAQGITLSVVAIGAGLDVERLEAIARNGGGAFHSTEDFLALPSILSQEAMMLANEPMESGVQPVIWADRASPFLAGLSETLPPIQGFVETTLKPGATLHLETVDGDGERVPLMASWAHGNGTVLAFATHAAGEGTAQWLRSADFPLLWAQAIRQFAKREVGPVELTLTRRGDEAIVSSATGLASVRMEKDGAPAFELSLVSRSDGTSTGSFVVEPGLYKARAEGDAPAQSAALVVNGSAALDRLRAPYPIEFFARATGGSVLAPGEELPRAGWMLAMAPAWRPWVLAGLALFLADLAMRYAPGLFGTAQMRRGRASGRKQNDRTIAA